MNAFDPTTDGTFTDGKLARRHAVRVSVETEGLRIVSDDGSVVETWRFEDIRLVDEVYSDRPIRLKRRSGPQRLTIANTDFLDQLRPRSRHLGRQDLRGRNIWLRGAGWIGAIFAILLGFWFVLPLAATPVASIIPLSWEEGLGEAATGQAITLIAPRSDACLGAGGQRAIERLVNRFAAVSPSRYRFRVTVIDSPMENAFAAPGGYVVIFRGLIDNAPDANAVAGVLAHEMGHVIRRHGMNQLVKALGFSLVIGALIGDTSSFGEIAAGVAEQLATSKFSRDTEREADEIAVDMLNRTNISGRGLQAFFQKFARQADDAGENVSSYFASHPATGTRAKFVQSRAKGLGNAMSIEEWQAVKGMCR